MATFQKSEFQPSRGGNISPKPPKTRPNYFVAVQISSPQIHESVKEIQQHISIQDRRFDDCMISVPTLHITLMVMNISDAETHNRAMKALANFHKQHNEVMCKNPLILEFCGLGHFNNRVIYGKIKENESYARLCQLADSVQDHFAEVDIFATDKERKYNPHLTIAKIDFSNRNQRALKKIQPSLYDECIDNHLGSESIRSIQLLKMAGPKDSAGYYTGDELLFWPPSSSYANISEKKKEIREKTAEVTWNALQRILGKQDPSD